MAMFHSKRDDFMFKVWFITRTASGLGRNIGDVVLASKMASMPLRFSMGASGLLIWTVPLAQHFSGAKSPALHRSRFSRPNYGRRLRTRNPADSARRQSCSSRRHCPLLHVYRGCVRQEMKERVAPPKPLHKCNFLLMI